MHGWMLPLSPVIAAAYFMVFPEQFGALVTWAVTFVR